MFFGQQLFVLARLAHDLQTAADRAIAFTGRSGVVEHDAQVERLAFADVGRQRQFFHRDFGTRQRADWHHVDAHAGLCQAAPLSQRVADVFVTVADDHDPLGRIVRERGLGQLHRAGDVGVFAIDQALDLGHLGFFFERRNLDRRFAAEHDHAGPIVGMHLPLIADRGFDVADHRLVLLWRDAHRLIEQVENRQAVGLADPLHFGQGANQGCQHGAA